MTRFLLATASVHTTAAAADYLADRLTADDAVLVLTVVEPGLPARDAGDAANVARSRLHPATVEVLEREGDPAGAIRGVLAERNVDEVLVGPQRGDPDRAGSGDGPGYGKPDPTSGEGSASGDPDGLGSTARALLGTVDVPVVVVPLEAL
ncbi:MAG: universal stress protein [Haloarculaceae archaeon]